MKQVIFILLFCCPLLLMAQNEIVVAKKGKADFRTIQEAINSLPIEATAPRVILIKKGTYNEKIFIDKNFVTLKGESAKSTCITISLARDEWRCSNVDDYGTAAINLKGNDIVLENLSFINSYGKDAKEDKEIICTREAGKTKLIKPTSHQMALRSFKTTRLIVKNCIFRAYGGDTVSPWNTWEGMYYFKDCIMEGGVDFYCPRGWALAENCLFICHNNSAAIWHDGSDVQSSKTVLINCRFTGDDGYKLGRYHKDAQFYLLNCSFSKNIADADIYLVPTSTDVIKWGRRVYYYNCKKDGGDFTWHTNNIPTALNNTSITPSWVFDGKWQPADEKELVVLKSNNENIKLTDSIDAVAEMMLLFQRSYGGWAKHYKEKAVDYTAKFTEAELAGIKDDKNRNDATIDNKATTKEIIYLVKAFTKTKNSNYLTAAENGIKYLLKMQYKNGGFPQFYPDLSSYRHQITFNDDAMVNVLNVLQDIAEQKNGMEVIDKSLLEKCSKAVKKAIDIILELQIKQNKTLTAWCAQYDENTYEPVMARKFELPSISGSESVGIVLFLMRQPNPSPKIINAVNSAMNWFEKSKVYDIEVKDIKDSTQTSGRDRIVVEKKGNILWARFYDIETNKPFFTGRNSTKMLSLDAIENERRVGYAYYVTTPAKLFIDKYPEWKKKNNIQ